MLAKKSPLPIAFYSSSSCISASLTSSAAPPPLCTSRRPRCQSRPNTTTCRSLYRFPSQIRCYAIPKPSEPINEPSSSSDESTPPTWPESKRPTPYEIFAIQPKAPYTKKRFSQLVKLYHPDLVVHHSSPLTPEVRLERYRLVVAANDLLSNPDKRHLYDTHGVGWVADDPIETIKNADRSWRHQPGSAAMNATWEDWERWHQAREGGPKQEPLYMSNALFATIIAGVALVAVLVQTDRAESTGAEYVNIQAVQHHSVGQQMMMNSMATAGLSKNERVDRFLRDRENVEYSFSPSKYDNRPEDHPDDHVNR